MYCEGKAGGKISYGNDDHSIVYRRGYLEIHGIGILWGLLYGCMPNVGGFFLGRRLVSYLLHVGWWHFKALLCKEKPFERLHVLARGRQTRTARDHATFQKSFLYIR